MILVALTCVPALCAVAAALDATTSWCASPCLGLVATELLFLQLPWKPAHLLPALLMLAAVAGGDRPQPAAVPLSC